MHFVKTRLNCNIKYGTQSRLNGGYKIPTFFCILRFLRTFDSLNFEKNAGGLMRTPKFGENPMNFKLEYDF